LGAQEYRLSVVRGVCECLDARMLRRVCSMWLFWGGN